MIPTAGDNKLWNTRGKASLIQCITTMSNYQPQRTVLVSVQDCCDLELAYSHTICITSCVIQISFFHFMVALILVYDTVILFLHLGRLFPDIHFLQYAI